MVNSISKFTFKLKFNNLEIMKADYGLFFESLSLLESALSDASIRIGDFI